MKTFNPYIDSPKKYFKVSKKDVNNTNSLLPKVLYAEMESFLQAVIDEHLEIINPDPTSFKLVLLNNAYLNDVLVFRTQIKKFDNLELHLQVFVNKNDDPICEAVFGYALKESIDQAS